MKANVKATMMETIKGLAAKCEGGGISDPRRQETGSYRRHERY